VPLTVKHRQHVWTAGLIVAKQRPPIAKDFAFYLRTGGCQRPDTGDLRPDLWEAHRILLRDARALTVHGQATVTGGAMTVKVAKLSELSLGGWAIAAD
jgi:error-prone DNA polymerase